MCEEIEQNDVAPENQNRDQFGEMDKSERIKTIVFTCEMQHSP